MAKTTIKALTTKATLSYLNNLAKRKKKAKWCIKNDLKMAQYLQPNNKKASIKSKKDIFKIRSNMSNIGSNYPNRKEGPNCILGCTQIENLDHIKMCSQNDSIYILSVDEIYSEYPEKSAKMVTKILQNRENKAKNE